MAALAKVTAISSEAALRVLGDTLVERTMAEPAVNSLEEDVIRVTIVLKPDAADRISGDQALGLIETLSRRFEDEGEVRPPMIEYATEEDLRFEEEEHRRALEQD